MTSLPKSSARDGLALVTGLLLVGGVVMVLVGWSRSWPERPTRRRESLAERWARLSRRPTGRAGRNRDLILVGSLAAGLVVAALSGWALAIVVAPLLVLGLPYLLVLPKARDVELLEALDRWVRALAASMTTGRSVTDAIRISRRTAPSTLAVEVGRLVDRLNSRWETSDALRSFADALDSPDADGVVAALILAARRGANGASQTLSALADSIQDQLKGRRAIETERAKPYVVVRQVTIISLITLGAMFVLSPGFFAAYATPLGQVILSVLVLLYLCSLILLRAQGAADPARANPRGRPSMSGLLIMLDRSPDRGWAGGAHRRARAERSAPSAGSATRDRRARSPAGHRRRDRLALARRIGSVPGCSGIRPFRSPSGSGRVCGCRASRWPSSTPTRW